MKSLEKYRKNFWRNPQMNFEKKPSKISWRTHWKKIFGTDLWNHCFGSRDRQAKTLLDNLICRRVTREFPGKLSEEVSRGVYEEPLVIRRIPTEIPREIPFENH